jgi:hypothetical protein
MTATNTANWIRTGLLALPVYGLLTFWATFTHEPKRTTEVEAYARFISSSSYLAQHLLGTILATFGVIALTAYLANSRVGRLALFDGVERRGILVDPDDLRLLDHRLTDYQAVVPSGPVKRHGSSKRGHLQLCSVSHSLLAGDATVLGGHHSIGRGCVTLGNASRVGRGALRPNGVVD